MAIKYINKSVCRGVAGKLNSVKGVMIHNTSDSLPAVRHAERLASYSTTQLQRGFAHYFIDESTVYRTEDTFNATWHAGNSVGNYNYISYEVVGDKNTDRTKFLQAEQNTFHQAAEDLRYYKLPVNRNTVRLHCELDVGTYTECPKRSMIEHGGWNTSQRQPQSVINKVKDYYISQILKYYNNPKLKPDGTGGTSVSSNKDNSSKYYSTGNYFVALKDLQPWNKQWTKKDNTWLLKAGSKFAVREKVVTKSGTVHAQVAGLSNTYVTLSKDYVKPQ